MSEWQPINALAIMDRTGQVLLYFADGRIRMAAYEPTGDSCYPYAWTTPCGSTLVRPWKDDEEPTHWMHLPNPPEVSP